MVDLPKVPRRLATTEAPRSSLTAADIRAPFGAMVSAMQEGADALSDVAEAHAPDAAARAVVTDAQGNVTVEPAPLPMVGKAGQKYRNHIQVAAVAAAASTADRDLLDLRAESRGDHGAFLTSANAYRDQKVGSLTAAIGEAGGAALRRQMDSRITSIYGGLQNERQRAELVAADNALRAKITSDSDEMETLARRNGIGEDYQERLGNVRALLQQRVNAPLSTFTNEQADLELDQLNTRLQGAAILEQTERVYREHGFDAAREHLRSAVRELDGKVKQLDKIEIAGMKFLRAEEAGMRGDRDAVSREWAAAKGQAATLPVEALDDLEARALETGNHRVAMDVATTRAALAINADIRQLPLADQARIARSGSLALVDRIARAESGGDPNAAATTSSARGLGQFVNSTWLDLIRRNRPDLADGKSDSEILALRSDPQLSREAIGLYAGENATKLAEAGVRTDDGALYLAHFLGPGDAIKVLAAPPDAPLTGLVNQASIEANRSIFTRNPTAGQLAAWAGGKVGGDLTGSRQGLVALGMLKRDLGRDLSARLGAVAQNVQRGQWPSADDVAELGAVVAVIGTPQQRRQVAAFGAMAEHGAAFKAMSGPQRDAAIGAWDARLRQGASQAESDLVATLRKADADMDSHYRSDPFGAYYKNTAGAKPLPPLDITRPDEAAAIVAEKRRQRDHIRELEGLPPFSLLRPAEANAFRGHLLSADPKRVAAAAMFGANLLATDPHAFAGVKGADGAEGIEEEILKFRHYVDDLGLSAQEAAAKLVEARDPEFKSRVKARVKNENIDEMLKKNVTVGELAGAFDLSVAFNPFLPSFLGLAPNPPVGFNPRMRDAMFRNYAELVKDRYLDSGDLNLAKSLAQRQLKQIWGPTEVNGVRTVMPYPPERSPQLAGIENAPALIAEQAIAAIKDEAGVDVPRAKVGFMPIPGLTAAAFKAGQAAPYQLTWTDANGVMHMLNPGRAFVVEAETLRQAQRSRREQRFRRGAEIEAARRETEGDPRRPFGVP